MNLVAGNLGNHKSLLENIWLIVLKCLTNHSKNLMEIHSEIPSEFTFEIFLEINLEIFETSLETKLETWLSMVVITKLLVWFYLIQFDSESFCLRSFENENFELVFMVLPGLNTWIIWNTKIASKSFPASEMTKLRKCSTRQKKLGKVEKAKKKFIL